MCIETNRFIDNCHVCRQHNLQKWSCNYILMKPHKRPFDSIVCNLIGCFHPPSRENTYALMHMCLLTRYSIVIPIPDKTSERLVQVYLQHLYATLSGSLTLIMDNSKELRNDLFQKGTSELGKKHQFSSPHNSQSNGFLEYFHAFSRSVLENKDMVNWTGKVHYSFCSSVLGCFWAVTLRRAHSSSFLVETL